MMFSGYTRQKEQEDVFKIKVELSFLSFLKEKNIIDEFQSTHFQ